MTITVALLLGAGAPVPSKVATPAPTATYQGHGAASVSKEVLERFAPTPIPADLSRKIQSYLDVRSPIGGTLTPDGKAIYFSWTVTGTRQVWRLDGPMRFPVQITGGEDRTAVGEMFPDGKSVVVTRDRNGEENPGLYLLDDRGVLSVIQHDIGIQAFLDFVSDDGKSIWFHANDVKPNAYAIYRWDVASKVRTRVFEQDGLWRVADHSGVGKGMGNRGIRIPNSE